MNSTGTQPESTPAGFKVAEVGTPPWPIDKYDTPSLLGNPGTPGGSIRVHQRGEDQPMRPGNATVNANRTRSLARIAHLAAALAKTSLPPNVAPASEAAKKRAGKPRQPRYVNAMEFSSAGGLCQGVRQDAYAGFNLFR